MPVSEAALFSTCCSKSSETETLKIVKYSLWGFRVLILCRIKHVHTLGIPCYLVVALDDELYSFLHNWLPEHVVRAPEGFVPAVPRQYAAPGTPAMRHVSRARLATLRAITEQARNCISCAGRSVDQRRMCCQSCHVALLAMWTAMRRAEEHTLFSEREIAPDLGFFSSVCISEGDACQKRSGEGWQ